jgi:hypothetical protein
MPDDGHQQTQESEMIINTLGDYRAAVRLGPYVWPGGYPLYFVCDDGGALCFACGGGKRLNRKEIIHSIARPEYLDKQWRVRAMEINWEEADLLCDHCYKQIESAYGD